MSNKNSLIDAKTVATYIERLARLKIWERETQHNLKTLSHQVRHTKKSDLLWAIHIDHKSPLRFKNTEMNQCLQPEIFCNIETSENCDFFLKKYELVFRIWSVCKNMSFKESRDSNKIFEDLKSQDYKRVMFRCHIEKTMTENEPIIHMQFGGIQRDDIIKECFWCPDNLPVPRFLSPPLDLILAIQIILTNFFPEIYKKEIKNEKKWVEMVKKSELMFQHHYYKNCSNYLKDNSTSILDSYIV